MARKDICDGEKLGPEPSLSSISDMSSLDANEAASYETVQQPYGNTIADGGIANYQQAQASPGAAMMGVNQQEWLVQAPFQPPYSFDDFQSYMNLPSLNGNHNLLPFEFVDTTGLFIFEGDEGAQGEGTISSASATEPTDIGILDGYIHLP